jgi:hypothetical protein
MKVKSNCSAYTLRGGLRPPSKVEGLRPSPSEAEQLRLKNNWAMECRL